MRSIAQRTPWDQRFPTTNLPEPDPPPIEPDEPEPGEPEPESETESEFESAPERGGEY